MVLGIIESHSYIIQILFWEKKVVWMSFPCVLIINMSFFYWIIDWVGEYDIRMIIMIS